MQREPPVEADDVFLRPERCRVLVARHRPALHHVQCLHRTVRVEIKGLKMHTVGLLLQARWALTSGIDCSGRSYAQVFQGFVRDAASATTKLRLDPNEPLYIIELGAGSGKFSFFMLKALSEMREVRDDAVPA